MDAGRVDRAAARFDEWFEQVVLATPNLIGAPPCNLLGIEPDLPTRLRLSWRFLGDGCGKSGGRWACPMSPIGRAGEEAAPNGNEPYNGKTKNNNSK
jgi:hypothetical protein